MTGKILCKTGADLVNATDPELIKFIGEIYYGLFRGGKLRQCGLGGRRSKFTSKYILVECLVQCLVQPCSFCLQNVAECKTIPLLWNLYLWLLWSLRFGI